MARDRKETCKIGKSHMNEAKEATGFVYQRKV